MSGGERVARRIARAGVCSRREAERRIAAGRVTVNGAALGTPAATVGPEDRVTVDGALVPPPPRTRLWRYCKPRGLAATHADERGRPTVFAHLPAALPRVVSVGRLDIASEGLLLLTNDGALARRLELPASGLVRRYRVRADGALGAAARARLAEGVRADGVSYGPVSVETDEGSGRNRWHTVALREGRNRELRKLFAVFGLKVSRLIRTAYGPFALGDLAPGSAAEAAPIPAIPAIPGVPAADGRQETRASGPRRRRGRDGHTRGGAAPAPPGRA